LALETGKTGLVSIAHFPDAARAYLLFRQVVTLGNVPIYRLSQLSVKRVRFEPIQAKRKGAWARPERRNYMESSGQGKWNQHWMDWLTHCEAIAETDAFVRSGHPEDQVFILKAKLPRAAVRGENWRDIYRSIYIQWRTRRPHFPDFNTLAAEIDQYRSRSNET